MSRIALGKITAPVGIKGEVRVYPYLDQARFSDIEKVSVGNAAPVRLVKSRPDKNMLVIKLEGTDDRNAAEELRNRELFLPDGETLDLGEDNYFIEELIGSAVKSPSGELLGVLKDVISRSFQDLYEVEKPDGGSFLIPAVKDLISDVDIENKVITVTLPEGLTDL